MFCIFCLDVDQLWHSDVREIKYEALSSQKAVIVIDIVKDFIKTEVFKKTDKMGFHTFMSTQVIS